MARPLGRVSLWTLRSSTVPTYLSNLPSHINKAGQTQRKSKSWEMSWKVSPLITHCSHIYFSSGFCGYVTHFLLVSWKDWSLWLEATSEFVRTNMFEERDHLSQPIQASTYRTRALSEAFFPIALSSAQTSHSKDDGQYLPNGLLSAARPVKKLLAGHIAPIVVLL